MKQPSRRLKNQMPKSTPSIHVVLCPTRWTVRVNNLQSIVSNNEIMQMLWKDAERDRYEEPDFRSTYILRYSDYFMVDNVVYMGTVNNSKKT